MAGPPGPSVGPQTCTGPTQCPRAKAREGDGATQRGRTSREKDSASTCRTVCHLSPLHGEVQAQPWPCSILNFSPSLPLSSVHTSKCSLEGVNRASEPVPGKPLQGRALGISCLPWGGVPALWRLCSPPWPPLYLGGHRGRNQSPGAVCKKAWQNWPFICKSFHRQRREAAVPQLLKAVVSPQGELRFHPSQRLWLSTGDSRTV